MNRKPTHPGKVFKLDVMPSFGLSVTEMAKLLGISRKQLSLFINERASLSPDMAFRIAEVTGTSAESWMRMQIKLSLWEKAQRKTTIHKEKPIAVNSKITRDFLEKLEDLYDIQAADEAYAAYLADPGIVSMDEIKKKYGVDIEKKNGFSKGLIKNIKEGEKEDPSEMKAYNPDEEW